MGRKTEGMPNDASQLHPNSRPAGIRWWPVGVILGVMVLAMAGVQSWSEFPFQRRNLICLGIAGGAAALLLVCQPAPKCRTTVLNQSRGWFR